MLIFLLVACTGQEPAKDSTKESQPVEDSGGDSGATDSPGESVPLDTGACDPGEGAEGQLLVGDIQGRVVWTVDFDAAAEATGKTDCTYTRVYSGRQRIDRDYLCPDCTWMGQATAEMTVGYEDCYLQIDDAPQIKEEMLGLAEVEGSLHLMRSGSVNVTPRDLAPIEGDTSDFQFTSSSTSELDSGGQATLTLNGGFLIRKDCFYADDPTLPLTEPSACGWARNNPGGPVDSYVLVDGGIFPNVRLEDQCEGEVDLWDFRGSYLIVDMAATNCGPCQQMAGAAEAFKVKAEEAGLDVELVTLLADSLSTVNVPADLATRQLWADTYGLSSPVLGDEGFAYALFPPYFDDGSAGYPTSAVIAPDGRLLGMIGGFGVRLDDQGNVVGNTFDDMAALIEADMAAQ
ncbi:MAG TPA: redoxin domain-containing protein [Myxococcota bacterium]|nr:redoxin domain-containing protein [Myxococcota bacterium]